VLFLLLFPVTCSAGNLIVAVKDVQTEEPISGAMVTLIVFNEKEESWQQNWWGVKAKGNGIVLYLDLEMWQKYVVRVEAKGYFSTFYGTPFYFYGVPRIITINSPNTRVEVFLQSEKEPPTLNELRTVKK